MNSPDLGVGVASEPNRRSYLWFDRFLVASLIFAAGFICGRAWRERSALLIYQYQQVKVLRKYADYHFSLEIDGRQTDAFFCDTYPQINSSNGLIAGCMLRDLRYEDNGSCWDVSSPWTGYHYFHNAKGDDLSWDGSVCWKSN